MLKDAKKIKEVVVHLKIPTAGGYYERRYVFSARLSYSYRSAFYSGLDRETAFSQGATGSFVTLFRFKISENMARWRIARQASNNPKLKYFALNNDQPRSIYQSGRQYF